MILQFAALHCIKLQTINSYTLLINIMNIKRVSQKWQFSLVIRVMTNDKYVLNLSLQ